MDTERTAATDRDTELLRRGATFLEEQCSSAEEAVANASGSETRPAIVELDRGPYAPRPAFDACVGLRNVMTVRERPASSQFHLPPITGPQSRAVLSRAEHPADAPRPVILIQSDVEQVLLVLQQQKKGAPVRVEGRNDKNVMQGKHSSRRQSGAVALCFKVPLEFRHWFKVQAVARNLSMTELLVLAAQAYIGEEMDSSVDSSVNTDLRK